MVRLNQLLLSQPEQDVKVAMQEEGCAHCFGCPNATLLAAEISYRTDSLLGFAVGTGGVDSKIYEKYEQEIADRRRELSEYTGTCKGYNDSKSDGSDRPAKMCSSPNFHYPRIQIIAGRILEIFGI